MEVFLEMAMFVRGTIPMHPEDQQLLEIARDLCRKLGYYNLNPNTISWKEKMGIRRLPADHFMIHPTRLRIKADVEAARILGKESLVKSLRKIDQLNPNRTGKRGSLARPTPSERVENLRRTDKRLDTR